MRQQRFFVISSFPSIDTHQTPALRSDLPRRHTQVIGVTSTDNFMTALRNNIPEAENKPTIGCELDYI